MKPLKVTYENVMTPSIIKEEMMRGSNLTKIFHELGIMTKHFFIYNFIFSMYVERFDARLLDIFCKMLLEIEKMQKNERRGTFIEQK